MRTTYDLWVLHFCRGKETQKRQSSQHHLQPLDWYDRLLIYEIMLKEEVISALLSIPSTHLLATNNKRQDKKISCFPDARFTLPKRTWRHGRATRTSLGPTCASLSTFFTQSQCVCVVCYMVPFLRNDEDVEPMSTIQPSPFFKPPLHSHYFCFASVKGWQNVHKGGPPSILLLSVYFGNSRVINRFSFNYIAVTMLNFELFRHAARWAKLEG